MLFAHLLVPEDGELLIISSLEVVQDLGFAFHWLAWRHICRYVSSHNFACMVSKCARSTNTKDEAMVCRRSYTEM
jgi:hypothetical protein